MKKLAIATLLVFVAGIASAACPTLTRYSCTQMPNGKMNCGCR